jgi:hypothetical protein
VRSVALVFQKQDKTIVLYAQTESALYPPSNRRILPLEEFKCKKCGNCCKNLFDDLKGEKRGLTLTPEESQLFPEKLVAPLAAFGLDAPDIIFLYQLSVNDCIYFNKENKCEIYENRPLVCRSFPLTQGSFSTNVNFFGF